MAVTSVCCMGVVAKEALCRCCCCCRRLKRPPPPPPPRTVLKLNVFSSFASICSPLDRKNPCRAASAAGTRSSSSSPSSPFISRSKFMPLVLKKLKFFVKKLPIRGCLQRSTYFLLQFSILYEISIVQIAIRPQRVEIREPIICWQRILERFPIDSCRFE